MKWYNFNVDWVKIAIALVYLIMLLMVAINVLNKGKL